MHRVDTEIRPRDWRLGQIIAERLYAGILTLSGYTDVDPQALIGAARTALPAAESAVPATWQVRIAASAPGSAGSISPAVST